MWNDTKMTDAEYIKIIEDLNREMRKSFIALVDAGEFLKEVTGDRPRYSDWLAERLK